MNELTLTQLATVAGLAYTLWQFSGARAGQAAELAELRTRVQALENQAQAWRRVERNVSDIMTALARLEERLTALDAKIDQGR